MVQPVEIGGWTYPAGVAVIATHVRQGEWRATVNRFLEMALFYDAGTVAARRQDLSLKGMKSDYGIGFRFHGPITTPLRIELAKGNEGVVLNFSASQVF